MTENEDFMTDFSLSQPCVLKMESCYEQAQDLTKKIAEDNIAVMKYFEDTAKNSLHIVLAMSPIGDDFKRRLRMFPALVNCCTIDWFLAWPKDALQSVA